MDLEELKKIYPQLLRKYLFESGEEEALYTAYELGKQCFEAQISMEDIMALHTSSLEELIKGLPLERVPEVMLRSSNLLLEFTVRFGLACQNYSEMVKRTDERIHKAFYQAGEILTAGLVIQKMLSAILGLVKNLTDAKACAVMLWENGRFTVKAEEGLEEGWIPGPESLAFQAMEEKAPKYIPEVEKETDLPRLKTRGAIRSLISLPIEVMGEALGVMEIYLGQPHVFAKEEMELLMSFARQASAAIENARLFSELQRREKTLETLYAIDRVVSQILDLDTIFHDALSKALEVTGTDSGGIFLLEEDGETLGLKVHLGLSDELARAVSKLKRGHGVSWMAVQSGKPVSLDIAKDPNEYPSPELLAPLRKDGIVSIASTPLLIKGRVIGAMTLNRRHRSFCQDDLDILASIGSQIAVAAENARLFSELQRHAQVIECLYDIDRVVTGSLDLEEVLKSALTKATEAVDADSGSIHLLDEKGENLILKTYSGLSQEFASIISKMKMGEGVTGRAAEMQKPETLDIAYYPSFDLLPHLEKEGIVSLASTPLIAKGKVLGAMTFTNRRYRIFSKDDLDLLASIGSQIGVAIENARLFSELQRHDKTLQALYSIDRVVSQTLDLDTIFRDALSKALEVTETEAGGIYLLEEDGETLNLKAHLSISEELTRAVSKIKVGQGVSGMAVKTGEPIALDIAKYPTPELLAPLIKEGIVSIVGVPLKAKEKIVGSITLANKRPRAFSRDDLDLLASIGSQIGVAIENSRLFSELERHHRMLETLYAIDRVISQTLDLESILRDALAKAMEVTETESGGIYLLEEDRETLSLKAHRGISEEHARAASKIKVGQGVTGLAAKAGKPMALDITQYPSPELLPLALKERQISIVGVPLIAKGKIVGAMGLAYKKPHSFSQEDLDLLATIGSQIGVAIENATLFSELGRHHKMLQALYSIENVVSRSLNLEEIFNTALSKVLEVTDTETGTLYSLEGDVLRLEAFAGLSPEFIEKAVTREVGEGIPGLAAQLKKAITMDISQFPSPHLLPYVEKEGLVSFIGTPLLSKDKVVGALALGRKKKRIFTQDDLDLVFSIGNIIGVAVENAGLYKEVKDKAEYISALYRIARAVKASLDIGEVFDAMVGEMKSILSFDRTSINLLKDGMVEVFALAEDIKIPELGRGTKIPRGKSSCGLILDRGVGLIRSLDKETPFYEDPFLIKNGIRTIIQVPLISKGERIGVFSLESSKPEAYAKRDLALAQAIADQIATSIENVRLYEDLKQANLELAKRLKELEEFHEMAVARELRMIELKERVRSIEER